MKFSADDYHEWWNNLDFTELATDDRNDYSFHLCVRGPVHWVHAGCRDMTIDEWRNHIRYSYSDDDDWKIEPTTKIINQFERVLIKHLKELAKKDTLFPGLRFGIKAKPKPKARKKARAR